MNDDPKRIFTTQTRLPSAVKVGAIEDIPETLDGRCDRVFAEDVRKRLDYEEMNQVKPENGTCRFCGRKLPIDYVQIGNIQMGVVQCNRVAGLWQRAENIAKERLAEIMRKRKEAVESAGSDGKTRRQWSG